MSIDSQETSPESGAAKKQPASESGSAAVEVISKQDMLNVQKDANDMVMVRNMNAM